jgi:N-acetylmuramoyl-L-alanine amidase
MTFNPVHVIDKTAETDPRVYGGTMTDGGPQGCIIHATGSSSEAGDEQWLSTYHANPVSIQQLVKRDGTIIQLVSNSKIAWHAGASSLNRRSDCNSWCMGIEICNRNDGKEAYTDAQYESVAQTLAYNCARYHIPDANVATHARVALPAGRKNDPLRFDMARLWARVQEIRTAWPEGWPPMWCCND